MSLKFRIALWIEKHFGSGSHVWCWKAEPCTECGKPTHWLEVNYGCRLHQGACTNALDVEYLKALRGPGL